MGDGPYEQCLVCYDPLTGAIERVAGLCTECANDIDDQGDGDYDDGRMDCGCCYCCGCDCDDDSYEDDDWYEDDEESE